MNQGKKLNLRTRTGPNRENGENLGFCSPRRRYTSWNGASSSRNTCLHPSEITWLTCWSSPQPRWRSGFRTAAINAKDSARTKRWRWWESLRPGASLYPFWFGMGSHVWETHQPIALHITWALTISPTTLIRLSAITRAPGVTQTIHATTPLPVPCHHFSPHQPTAITWISE